MVALSLYLRGTKCCVSSTTINKKQPQQQKKMCYFLLGVSNKRKIKGALSRRESFITQQRLRLFLTFNWHSGWPKRLLCWVQPHFSHKVFIENNFIKQRGRCSQLLWQLTVFISNTRSLLRFLPFVCQSAGVPIKGLLWTGNNRRASWSRFSRQQQEMIMKESGCILQYTAALDPLLEEVAQTPQELCRIQPGENNMGNRKLQVLPARVCIVVMPVNLQHTGSCRQQKKAAASYSWCSAVSRWVLHWREHKIHVSGFITFYLHDGDNVKLQQQPWKFVTQRDNNLGGNNSFFFCTDFFFFPKSGLEEYRTAINSSGSLSWEGNKLHFKLQRVDFIAISV